ncbi:MAG: hypothetical protein WCD43_01270 [Candidatus Acidiferrales bacterium]
MKWRFPLFGPLAVLALSLFATPIYAQTATVTTKPVVHRWYDSTKEVTLSGTVTSVVKSATREMKMMGGSHLVVETKSGTIDASLGKFAMRGEGALDVTPGQKVQVTGVMKTVNDKQVLLTRVVQTNGHTFTIRNEHGFALAPAARKGSANSEAKGGQL